MAASQHAGDGLYGRGQIVELATSQSAEALGQPTELVARRAVNSGIDLGRPSLAWALGRARGTGAARSSLAPVVGSRSAPRPSFIAVLHRYKPGSASPVFEIGGPLSPGVGTPLLAHAVGLIGGGADSAMGSSGVVQPRQTPGQLAAMDLLGVDLVRPIRAASLRTLDPAAIGSRSAEGRPAALFFGLPGLSEWSLRWARQTSAYARPLDRTTVGGVLGRPNTAFWNRAWAGDAFFVRREDSSAVGADKGGTAMTAAIVPRRVIAARQNTPSLPPVSDGEVGF